MPLYDGIATDKHCVILDIGHAYTKCGFARESGPRWILPSEIKSSEGEQVKKIWDYKSVDELQTQLKSFLHTLYFKHLVVNPKDRRVVIVESVLCPTDFRETLAKVLFLHFEAPSILFVPSHLMVVYTLGLSSAIVVDVGYSETVVLPIFEKVPILSAWEAIPLGSEAIHRRIEAELMEKGQVKGAGEKQLTLGSVLDEPLAETTLEDIKVRACFVTTLERGKSLQHQAFAQKFPASVSPDKKVEFLESPFDVAYPINGEKVLAIPGTLREYGPELLFELDGDEQSIATILLESILRCPIDIRRTLTENVVLVGGTCMLPGFKHRFLKEVQHLMTSPESHYSQRLPIKGIKIHQPPAKDNYTSWLGAAIFGATDVVITRSLTRELYMQQGHLTDWSDQSWSSTESEKTLV